MDTFLDSRFGLMTIRATCSFLPVFIITWIFFSVSTALSIGGWFAILGAISGLLQNDLLSGLAACVGTGLVMFLNYSPSEDAQLTGLGVTVIVFVSCVCGYFGYWLSRDDL
ncbi:hypothetical protein [Candidatus Uabimicrobium amorphum]|uniref:Uncharacterized protein n=1 Tax=Uabimicrobium amorphum TaxID=2596890 RepID=A0A5S9F2Z5_UABAM|nr:hypothetical protein [Candidatus Uabimicrobium amorphum]BBM83731.1 hypothetical protein UABAM_02084 [Candidatus Uabimicrobium amorphum]